MCDYFKNCSSKAHQICCEIVRLNVYVTIAKQMTLTFIKGHRMRLKRDYFQWNLMAPCLYFMIFFAWISCWVLSVLSAVSGRRAVSVSLVSCEWSPCCLCEPCQLWMVAVLSLWALSAVNGRRAGSVSLVSWTWSPCCRFPAGFSVNRVPTGPGILEFEMNNFRPGKVLEFWSFDGSPGI